MNWAENLYGYIFSPEECDAGVRIMIFRLFGGLKRHWVVKHDVRYHKIAQNFIQMMLECQQMIEMGYKFIRIHIFIRGTRWWCQNSNILIYWRLTHDCGVKYDVRYYKIAQNFIQMMLESQKMIKLSCKFISSHIFTQGSWWSCQIYDILTFWRAKTSLFPQIWHQI